MLVLFTISCLAHASVAVERKFQSVSLFRADAKEVAKLIKQLVSEDSSVVPYRDVIVFSVTDDEFEIIEALVKKLDVPPHQLMITVRTPKRKTQAGRSGVNGVISSERQSSVVVSVGSSQSAPRGEQLVRVTEGVPAYISAGREVPVRTDIFDDNNHYRSRTDYKRVERGFYVSARVQEDQVVLDIYHADDSIRRDGESFDRQRVDTQVSGNVGEWLTIASTSREEINKTRSFNVQRYSTVDSVYEVLVKVDVLE